MSGYTKHLFFTLLVLISSIAYGALGDFDTAFGTNGMATYNGGNNDEGHAIALQGDGRIVVAGSTYNGTTADLLVVRYNTDGSLDTTFGTSGVADSVSSEGGGFCFVNSLFEK